MKTPKSPNKIYIDVSTMQSIVQTARDFSVDGWEFDDWPHIDSCPDRLPEDAIHHFYASINNELLLHGYGILSMPDFLDTVSEAEAASSITLFLSNLGCPLRIFLNRPHWRRLGVDTSRSPERSEGTGRQSFHIDFVNAENPPDLVCLLCIRQDSLGGGASLISEIHGIEQLLAPSHVALLSQSEFKDGEVRNLNGVGEDINPFPVLALGSVWQYRYTNNLLGTTEDPLAHVALQAVADILEHRAITITLDRGDLLILDQHRVTHGRGALGEGQENIPYHDRRLLLQSFVRRNIIV